MITYKILFLGTLKANINPQEIPIAPIDPNISKRQHPTNNRTLPF